MSLLLVSCFVFFVFFFFVFENRVVDDPQRVLWG
jgi:hypothetical protein